jgi:hypothetical protein
MIGWWTFCRELFWLSPSVFRVLISADACMTAWNSAYESWGRPSVFTVLDFTGPRELVIGPRRECKYCGFTGGRPACEFGWVNLLSDVLLRCWSNGPFLRGIYLALSVDPRRCRLSNDPCLRKWVLPEPLEYRVSLSEPLLGFRLQRPFWKIKSLIFARTTHACLYYVRSSGLQK